MSSAHGGAHSCEFIKNAKETKGTFSIHTQAIVITLESAAKVYVIPAGMIEHILQRRRFHHPTAIEIFCLSGRTYFVNFPEYHSTDIIQTLGKIEMPHRQLFQRNINFLKYFQEQRHTKKWSAGEMSNFEYLILLNIFSGRSFADPSQYPFFPMDCQRLQV
jgi:hypothetical protein